MTRPRRSRRTGGARMARLGAAGCLVVLLSGCAGGSADGSAVELAETLAVATTPAAAPTATPDGDLNPEAVTEPTPPVVVETAVETGPTTVTFWYPLRDIDGTAPTQSGSFEREIGFARDATVQQRLATIVELWVRGPTGVEVEAGFLGFNYRFSYCDPPFVVEATETAALVTICVPYSPHGDGLLGATLSRTLEAAGLVDEVGVLYVEGERCVAPIDDVDPLSCLPTEFRPAGANRCPRFRATTTALVTGVDQWVNSRLWPSVDSPEAERLAADALVTVHPSTLRYDGSEFWWLTVQLAGEGRCAWVAAHHLVGPFGNFGDIVPGVEFRLPSMGSWTFVERESVFDRTEWYLEGAFSSSVSLQVYDGNRIDEWLTWQLENFERLDYDYPDDWYDEVEVEGADRAVRPVFIISESGDVGRNELLIEVGDFTIQATTGVYIEDVRLAPHDEMDAFLRSIRVDRRAFIDAFTTPSAVPVALFDNDYLAVPQVSGVRHDGSTTCATMYDVYVLDEIGLRRYAGQLGSARPTELPEQYLLWEVCEGVSPVVFAVARVDDGGDDDGSIRMLGTVPGEAVGVRADFGTHRVDNDGNLVFEGRGAGGETYVDTFGFGDLLDQLAD